MPDTIESLRARAMELEAQRDDFACREWRAEKARRAAEAKAESLQAQLDALMFEHCPGEMTAEQIERWEACQRVSSAEEARRIAESIAEGARNG